jgi:hypothetical protein
MKVARHEMPGNMATKCPSRRVRYDPVAQPTDYPGRVDQAWANESHRSLRDGPRLPVTQAFHAWLPSFCPSGTEPATRFQRAWAKTTCG